MVNRTVDIDINYEGVEDAKKSVRELTEAVSDTREEVIELRGDVDSLSAALRQLSANSSQVKRDIADATTRVHTRPAPEPEHGFEDYTPSTPASQPAQPARPKSRKEKYQNRTMREIHLDINTPLGDRPSDWYIEYIAEEKLKNKSLINQRGIEQMRAVASKVGEHDTSGKFNPWTSAHNYDEKLNVFDAAAAYRKSADERIIEVSNIGSMFHGTGHGKDVINAIKKMAIENEKTQMIVARNAVPDAHSTWMQAGFQFADPKDKGTFVGNMYFDVAKERLKVFTESLTRTVIPLDELQKLLQKTAITGNEHLFTYDKIAKQTVTPPYTSTPHNVSVTLPNEQFKELYSKSGLTEYHTHPNELMPVPSDTDLLKMLRPNLESGVIAPKTGNTITMQAPPSFEDFIKRMSVAAEWRNDIYTSVLENVRSDNPVSNDELNAILADKFDALMNKYSVPFVRSNIYEGQNISELLHNKAARMLSKNSITDTEIESLRTMRELGPSDIDILDVVKKPHTFKDPHKLTEYLTQLATERKGEIREEELYDLIKEHTMYRGTQAGSLRMWKEVSQSKPWIPRVTKPTQLYDQLLKAKVERPDLTNEEILKYAQQEFQYTPKASGKAPMMSMLGGKKFMKALTDLRQRQEEFAANALQQSQDEIAANLKEQHEKLFGSPEDTIAPAMGSTGTQVIRFRLPQIQFQEGQEFADFYEALGRRIGTNRFAIHTTDPYPEREDDKLGKGPFTAGMEVSVKATTDRVGAILKFLDDAFESARAVTGAYPSIAGRSKSSIGRFNAFVKVPGTEEEQRQNELIYRLQMEKQARIAKEREGRTEQAQLTGRFTSESLGNKELQKELDAANKEVYDYYGDVVKKVKGMTPTIKKDVVQMLAEEHIKIGKGGKLELEEAGLNIGKIIDGLATKGGMLGKLSWTFTSLAMSALGVYFSLMSIVNMLSQGIMSVFNPLQNLQGLIQSYAIAQMHLKGTAADLDKYYEGLGISVNDLGEASLKWQSIMSGIAGTLGGFGASIILDPDIYQALIDVIAEIQQFLSSKEVTALVKDLIYALRDNMPQITDAFLLLGNLVKNILVPNIGLFVKAWSISMIVMPIASLASAILNIGKALVFTTEMAMGLKAALGGLSGLSVVGSAASEGGAGMSLAGLLGIGTAGTGLGAAGTEVAGGYTMSAVTTGAGSTAAAAGTVTAITAIAGALAVLFAGLAVGYAAWVQNWNGIRDKTAGVAKDLKEIFSGMSGAVGNVEGGGLIDAVSELAKAFGELQTIWMNLSGSNALLGATWEFLRVKLKELTVLLYAFSDGINVVIDGIKVLSQASKKIAIVGDVVGALVPWAGKNGEVDTERSQHEKDLDAYIAGKATKRASGGPLRAGQMAIVGERGPELLIPKGDVDVVPNHKVRFLAGGTSAISTVDNDGRVLIKNTDAVTDATYATEELTKTIKYYTVTGTNVLPATGGRSPSGGPTLANIGSAGNMTISLGGKTWDMKTKTGMAESLVDPSKRNIEMRSPFLSPPPAPNAPAAPAFNIMEALGGFIFNGIKDMITGTSVIGNTPQVGKQAEQKSQIDKLNQTQTDILKVTEAFKKESNDNQDTANKYLGSINASQNKTAGKGAGGAGNKLPTPGAVGAGGPFGAGMTPLSPADVPGGWDEGLEGNPLVDFAPGGAGWQSGYEPHTMYGPGGSAGTPSVDYGGIDPYYKPGTNNNLGWSEVPFTDNEGKTTHIDESGKTVQNKPQYYFTDATGRTYGPYDKKNESLAKADGAIMNVPKPGDPTKVQSAASGHAQDFLGMLGDNSQKDKIQLQSEEAKNNAIIEQMWISKGSPMGSAKAWAESMSYLWYDIPSAAKGGLLKADGLINAHAGEVIGPLNQVASAMAGAAQQIAPSVAPTQNITVTVTIQGNATNDVTDDMIRKIKRDLFGRGVTV